MKKFDSAKFLWTFFALVSLVCAFMGLIASIATISFVPFLLLIPGILFLSASVGFDLL